MDWKKIAEARGLRIPEAELEIIVRRQAALDQVFRPLASALTPSQEPAAIFQADLEDE